MWRCSATAPQEARGLFYHSLYLLFLFCFVFFFFQSKVVLVSLLSDVWASFVLLATFARHILNYWLKECKFYTVLRSFCLSCKNVPR